MARIKQQLSCREAGAIVGCTGCTIRNWALSGKLAYELDRWGRMLIQRANLAGLQRDPRGRKAKVRR